MYDTGAIRGAEKKQETFPSFVFSNAANRNAYKTSAEKYLGICSLARMRGW